MKDKSYVLVIPICGLFSDLKTYFYSIFYGPTHPITLRHPPQLKKKAQCKNRPYPAAAKIPKHNFILAGPEEALLFDVFRRESNEHLGRLNNRAVIRYIPQAFEEHYDSTRLIFDQW